ncbi:restriction endonuclease subunit S [uncultured Nostoc sp.]|uniref:restriction endonuclease subunit S n=1 Tax=uncultured Nostoc sp. TaxID=340711 RepID=UPI0035CB1926
MSWSKSTLDELAFFQRGFDITMKQLEDGNYPVISSSGVQGYHSVAKVKGPGVIIGRKGTLGSVHYIESDFWPHDTTLWVKDFKGNNPKFVYYFLKTLELERFDSGGANPTLNRNHIHGLEIIKPLPVTQQRIADILSTYDRLIDNNNRRIALLEESIHQLYKEWFVHLRFPGYESVKVVDGIPEGWKIKSLKDIATLNYGKSLTKQDRKNGSIPVYGSSGIIGYHDKALIKEPGIIVGRKGNIGTVYWCPTSFYPIDTVYYINNSEVSFFLYHTLSNFSFISTDAAVPGLNRNYAYSLPVLIPTNNLRESFEALAIPIYKQLHCLQVCNNRLTTARDLLLPRLMNGSIAV